MKNMITGLDRPPVNTKSKSAFWDDEYISMQMLKAHLDPEFDAATRKIEFVEKSADWIQELVSPSDYSTLLDIGCGPGIYAEKFNQAGYQVTGVDFSKRSIAYAKQSALMKHLDITYLYQDYLKMDLGQTFDFCTMIYCDYGALSTEDRKIVMKKAYDHLKPGGKFLFDVFTLRWLDDYQEQQTWESCPNGGFWRGDDHVVLNGFYKYGDNVTLHQVIVISEDEITPYYIWDTYFTKETITKEAEEAGFQVCDIYGDVAGSIYEESSKTMAVILMK